MAVLLPPPGRLELKEVNKVSSNWKIFLQSWINYEVASGTATKEDHIRVATFLHVAGQDALEKYNTFSWQSIDDKLIMTKVIDKFTEECSEKTNVIIERYKFLKQKQLSGESCDQFVQQLKVLVATCNYTNVDEALRDQFVLQLRDNAIREKLLDQAQLDASALTFDKAVLLGKTYEATRRQKEDMAENQAVYAVKRSKANNKVNDGVKSCTNCGFDHQKNRCPAYGKECYDCGKSNHFARYCRKKTFVRKDHKSVNKVDIRQEECFVNSDVEDQMI